MTGLSSEPTRWSCDNCQRMSDFDSCQSNSTHTDGLHNWKASQVVQDLLDIWHRHKWSVCTGGRADVRYVITKFSRMDSLPNFVTHGAPLRAICARELRYNMLIKVITNRLQKVLCSDDNNTKQIYKKCCTGKNTGIILTRTSLHRLFREMPVALPR